MIVRVTLISVGFIIALTQTSLIAQQHRSPISQSQQADAQLNRTYQQLMKTLSPIAKEQLRKAERAWLEFVARNKAAFQAAAPRLGLSASQCDGFEVDELFSRGNELSAISQPNQSANEQAAAHLPRTDEELNIVYKRCLGAVTGSDVQKLRDAQKAWIVFRDANSGFGTHLLLVITSRRIEQLNDFYIKTAQELPGMAMREPSRPVPEKADPSVPDPFERAR